MFHTSHRFLTYHIELSRATHSYIHKTTHAYIHTCMYTQIYIKPHTHAYTFRCKLYIAKIYAESLDYTLITGIKNAIYKYTWPSAHTNQGDMVTETSGEKGFVGIKQLCQTVVMTSVDLVKNDKTMIDTFSS